MQATDYCIAKRLELLSIANKVLHGQINPIEGIRKINALRYDIGDSENEVFLPIRGIDSETDHFPLGTVRKNWDIVALKEIDDEMESYLLKAKNDIFQSCQEIIQTFS